MGTLWSYTALRHHERIFSPNGWTNATPPNDYNRPMSCRPVFSRTLPYVRPPPQRLGGLVEEHPCARTFSDLFSLPPASTSDIVFFRRRRRLPFPTRTCSTRGPTLDTALDLVAATADVEIRAPFLGRDFSVSRPRWTIWCTVPLFILLPLDISCTIPFSHLDLFEDEDASRIPRMPLSSLFPDLVLFFSPVSLAARRARAVFSHSGCTCRRRRRSDLRDVLFFLVPLKD